MSWVLLVAGLLLAFAGTAGASALVTAGRAAVAEAVSRRLRGGGESLAWLATTERQVVAASAVASFGVGLAGAAIPGVFSAIPVVVFGMLLFLLVVPITLLGGYLLPHWLTVTRAEWVVDRLRPVLAVWATMLGVVLPARSPDPADEIRALAREGGGVADNELMMIGGVMAFADTPVRDVMTPRTDVVAVSQDAPRAEVTALFTESGYTRLPVYRHTLDEIVGMVHAFDLFKQGPDDPLPLRPVTFAPAPRPAGDQLLDMQRGRQHLAVVVDEFGGTAGIVTLEDLLENLVGEISDEDDPVAAPPSAGAMLEVDGSMSLETVAEHFAVPLPDRDTRSVGGILAERAGRIPVAGDRFTLLDLDIDVLQASPTRVERVLVRRAGGARVRLDRG